ncbi:LTA synthase family protein [Paenibacillus hemerocallicola]|uniref:LTA synthase family protein n=1 Tax=Paenibacillus hemerocallicola TaxID=1172614 RepID=A0A5C4SY30_9BACL|nr:LTA synthase family protein [Paenibacillus hemerocallicola]TNJ61532.1 LTA synthase family protein [Paenibacillus hemerocallicola]
MRNDRTAPFLWKSLFFRITVFIWIKLIVLRVFIYHKIDWGGVALDLASVVVIAGLIELFVPGRAKRAAFWSLNIVASLILFAATLYYTHFGSIVTYTSLYGLKQVLQVSNSVKRAMHPENYIFFVDLAAAVLLWIVWRRRNINVWSSFPLRKASMAAVVVVALAVSALSIRVEGKVRNELIRAEKLGFFNYQSSFVLEAWENSRETKFTDTDQAAGIINAVQSKYPYGASKPDGEQEPRLFGTQKGKNLIVVQVESLQNFTIGYTVEGQPLTPVLNELAGSSYYFPNVFQQIGQGNTSDAEFMFNTSIYPAGSIPMSTGFGNRELPSLPKLLKAEGYESMTFHVNDVRFWDRDKMYPALGFDRYYDEPYFQNDEFNAFGASDEQLFRTGIQQLKGLSGKDTPFYAQFVTASSHHPFVTPDNKKQIRLPAEKYKDTQVGEYLESVNYADHALGTFIDQLKATGLWDSSIVVVYGDHSGLKPQYNDPEEVTRLLGIPYDEYVTRFNVPFIVHVPGQTEGETVEQVGGQLDMMPTVANLLGISFEDSNYVHFGHDLMNTDRNVFGIRYYLPTGSFVNDDILFIPGEGFEDGKAVSLRTLQPVSDYAKYKKDYYYTMALMRLSDEYMKILPRREGY